MIIILNVSYEVFVEASNLFRVYYYIKEWTGAPDSYVMACGSGVVIYRTEITDSTDITDFLTNLEPTAIEVNTEDDIIAKPTLIDTSVQFKYDIQDTIIYVGRAKKGVAASAAGWTIEKITLINGDPTDKKLTKKDIAVWDNRTTESYS